MRGEWGTVTAASRHNDLCMALIHLCQSALTKNDTTQPACACWRRPSQCEARARLIISKAATHSTAPCARGCAAGDCMALLQLLPSFADCVKAAGGRIQWQRAEPVCGSCLVLNAGQVCQVAQPQCSRRPRRQALLPGDFDTVNRLLHQEASLWEEGETKRVRQGAGGGGAHSIAA